MPSKHTVKLVVGRNPETGQQIRKTFSGKTKKEAIRKRDEYRFKMQHGIYTYDLVTFGEVAEEWLSITKEGIVADTTYTNYEIYIRNCNDYFKNRAIQSITTADLNRLIKKYTDKSESYMHLQKITIKQIFKYAFQSDYIPKNPAENMINLHGKEPKVKVPYTEDEMRLVLDYAKENKYGLGPFITLKTGVRCGELMGLMTSDFDMELKRVNIRRTAKNSSSADIIKIGGKTKNAVRTIPLDTETVNYLKTREEFETDRYVFLGTISRKPIAPHEYAKWYYSRFMEDLELYTGVRKLNPHYLRHTYGTHLYRMGNDLFKIMKIMGHSSIETTSRIYVHETIDDIENGLIL